MNRRRFLAALLATPVAVALAPLLPKPWTAAMRAEYGYQVNTRLNLMRADISDFLLESLKVESTLPDQLSGVRLDFPQRSDALRFQWQEDV